MSTRPPATSWLDDLDPRDLDAAVERLRVAAGGSRVVVAAHVGPDGDALGGALTVHRALLALGARSSPTWGEEPMRVPAAYADLPGIDDLVPPSAVLADDVDLLVTVDVASAERLGDLAALVDRGVETLVLDHHPTNTRFGTHNVVAPRAAATVVVIDEVLRRLGVPLDRELATCLYVGLVTDTGRFGYTSTDAAAMALGGRLIEAGAPHVELTRRLFDTRTLGELLLLGRALGRLTFVPEAGLAHAYVTAADLAEAGVGLEAAEPIIDVVRTADVAEVAMVAREQVAGDGWRVSLRSLGEVDVAAIASDLGGGGHTRAAGFSAVGPLDEVVATVTRAVLAARSARSAPSTPPASSRTSTGSAVAGPTSSGLPESGPAGFDVLAGYATGRER